jgi:hypothetical protein
VVIVLVAIIIYLAFRNRGLKKIIRELDLKLGNGNFLGFIEQNRQQRETLRQRDRETERQRDRETERQRDRETERS